MPASYKSPLLRAACALGLVLALAGCTKGGQFDPTELLNSDALDSKTKLKGDRVPIFPNGVPGTTTGVPPDLVKGYQARADQAEVELPPAPASAEPAKPKPKSKPKVAVEKPPASRPTRINVGVKAGAPAQPPPASAWPTPQGAPAQQSAWPAPSQTTPQSAWPAPPQTRPTQQAAQPAQPAWPNPPASGTTSQ